MSYSTVYVVIWSSVGAAKLLTENARICNIAARIMESVAAYSNYNVLLI